MLKLWLVAAAGVLAACDSERSETTTRTESNVSITEQRPERAGASAAARLDCPDQQGRLSRVAAGADGRLCQYRAEGGAEVELRLTELSQLPALEAELATLLSESADFRADSQAVSAAYEEAQAKYDAAMDAYEQAMEAYDELGDPGGAGAILPVPPPPPGPPAPPPPDIGAGGVIRAIHHRADAGPGGWRSVGYHLRGPASGPRVVGLLRARSGGENRELMKDVGALVDRNMRG